ncbi:DUF488 domain-containing protein [Micromonospora zhanjiangensis]|uniref:DUF488 family protein n=1 Tax=Micromonospora zhanjiangensis TaxID=1522057 RepID=A0ABV8KM05_9ACTN
MTVQQRVQTSGVLGIGYEGRDIDGFVDELLAQDVTRLVDVRLTPISRKRGFSKTALGQALRDAGIAYQHCPQLGNPKDNRAGFAGTPLERERARSIFAARLRHPDATRCLAEVARAAASERIALLCFEADQERCHRDVVIAELAAQAR